MGPCGTWFKVLFKEQTPKLSKPLKSLKSKPLSNIIYLPTDDKELDELHDATKKICTAIQKIQELESCSVFQTDEADIERARAKVNITQISREYLMFVFASVCMQVCVYVYVYVCVFVGEHVRVCESVRVYVWVHVCHSVRACVCVFDCWCFYHFIKNSLVAVLESYLLVFVCTGVFACMSKCALMCACVRVVCVYMCVYICACVCVCLCMCLCVCVRARMCARMCTHVHVVHKVENVLNHVLVE